MLWFESLIRSRYNGTKVKLRGKPMIGAKHIGRDPMPRQLEKSSAKLLPEDGKSQWVKCWKCGAWIHCRKCLTHHLYNIPHK
jgi:hypothetical protein